jgi:hypothetical protein
MDTNVIWNNLDKFKAFLKEHLWFHLPKACDRGALSGREWKLHKKQTTDAVSVSKDGKVHRWGFAQIMQDSRRPNPEHDKPYWSIYLTVYYVGPKGTDWPKHTQRFVFDNKDQFEEGIRCMRLTGFVHMAVADEYNPSKKECPHRL